MKHVNFAVRAVNLLLIFCALWQYQQVAAVRAQAVTQNRQQIAEVEAYNAALMQQEEEPEESGYRDGTYEGAALGFGDTITVSVTVQAGKMTDIAVLNADGEDRPYYDQALRVLDEMLAAQSTEVDAVAGATLTAEGMIDAVADALGKAAA